jgi:5-methylcytosine-specific restriction endonuclease McrA
MSHYFQICNFERVSIRRELKLSPRMLNDQRYISLPDNAKALLIGCMLLAARCGNILPYEPLTLARRTGVDPHYDDQADGAVRQLEQSGFIKPIAERQLESRSRRLRLSDSVRAQVLLRDGARCRRCATLVLEIDHIEPFRSGGDDDFNNLQTLCRRCNRRKGSRTAAIL